jgi:hypothetical protein
MELEEFKVLLKSFLMKYTELPESEIDDLVLFNACYISTPKRYRHKADEIMLEAAIKMRDNLSTEEERSQKN